MAAGASGGAGASAPCLPRAAVASVSVCAASAGASLALAMLNKALLSSYDFRGYFALLACQMGFSWAVCVVSRDRLGNPFRVPAYRPASARAGAWMGVLYVLNVVVGMVGLRLVNVPLFFAIRRLTPALIIAMDWALFRKVADGGTQLAVALSVAGTLVAAWETLSSDGLGYAIALANNAVTAGLLLAQKRFQEMEAQRERDAAAAATAAAAGAAAALTSAGAAAPVASPPPPPPVASASGTFGVLYYNAMLAAPLAAALCVASGEVGYIAGFPHLRDPRFLGGFALSSAMGIVLTYTAVLATTFAGPLAVGMTGNVKDLATTAIGAVYFGGFVATAMSVGGLGLSFAGAFLFGAVALQRSRRAAAAEATPSAAKGSGSLAAFGSYGVDSAPGGRSAAITDGGSWPGHTLRRAVAANAADAAAGGGGGGGGYVGVRGRAGGAAAES
jgi:solute carrier family 35